MTIIELVKQICLLPRNLSEALKQKRVQGVRDANEVERLDRIRNPSKYLGK